MKLSIRTDGGKLSSLAPADKDRADQQLTGADSKAPETAKRSSGGSSDSSRVIASAYNAALTLLVMLIYIFSLLLNFNYIIFLWLVNFHQIPDEIFLCTDNDAGDNFLAELLSSLTLVANSRALDNPTANDGESHSCLVCENSLFKKC